MDEALNTLGARKDPFLDKVSDEIDSFIVKQGCHCLDILEKSAEKEDQVIRTWRASVEPDFCKVLYHFVRRKPHKGHVLDSALTIPVCDIVCNRYGDFYQENADVVSAGVLAALTKDNLILDSFLSRVADKALSKASKEVRKRIVHLIVHQIHSSASNGALHVVGQQIGHAAATTAGSQVAALVAQVIVKLLAAHIGALVAKILSSALIKKLVALLVKKVVVVAVGAAVVNFLAVHVSAAIGGSSVMWVVIPGLIGFMAYKIATFPKKIGKEVSKSVHKELLERFMPMNKSILDKIYEQVINGEELVNALAEDEEFKSILTDLAKKV
jgi:hypothetical protein